ncbi:MAG: dihydroxyacetone kinase subunit DhaL [Anaerolineae bacterium]
MSLTVEQTQAMLLHVAVAMQAERDVLTQADRAIGDGDHGIGMARGFAAVQAALEARQYDSVGTLFRAVGTTLLSATGGAAGAIFGTLFRGGAANLDAAQQLDAAALTALLGDGLAAVRERGKAAPGDKTVVDALVPVADRAAALRGGDLAEAITAAAAAAAEGVEATKAMVARVGKAKTLGERSLGHADPGALSMALILRHMSEYVMSKE